MKINNLRWWIVTLVALATVINYIDRQSLAVLWPEISQDLYPDKSSDEVKEIFAFISVVFVFSYAFGQAMLSILQRSLNLVKWSQPALPPIVSCCVPVFEPIGCA